MISKSNRSPSLSSIEEDNVVYINYDRIDLNIINVKDTRNLDLQDLDLNFSREFESNPNRFKIIKSKNRFKGLLKLNFYCLLLLSLIMVISLMLNEVDYSIVNDSYLDSNYFNLSINTVLSLLVKLSYAGISIVLISTILIFCLRRPFFKLSKNRYYVIVLDGIGFYKIDLNFNNPNLNKFNDLYLIGFLSNKLSKPVFNYVDSISYYSNYDVVYCDSRLVNIKAPIGSLDLIDNENLTSANYSLLEISRRDLKNLDFKYLLNCLLNN